MKVPRCCSSLSPTLERMVIELALGQDAIFSALDDALTLELAASTIWPPSDTTADRAADLLAATAALAI